MREHHAETEKDPTPTNGPANAEVESLKDGLAQLRADVMNLFSHALGLGKTSADAVGQSASEAMESLKERAAEMKRRGADATAAVGKKIEDHPLSSVLIAFGVGYLLAKLFNRRR